MTGLPPGCAVSRGDFLRIVLHEGEGQEPASTDGAEAETSQRMTDMPTAGRTSSASECLGSVTEAAQLVAAVGHEPCVRIRSGLIDPA
jgi:hypothetical protein